ncbi:MAG: hypothetical protein Q9213_000988 [Squamulea squamosa]
MIRKSHCVAKLSIIISITCLAVAQPKQSSHTVWYDSKNDTGWSPNVLVFMMGLTNPVYGFGGLDGAVYLGEDCFEPAKSVLRAIISSLVVGFITTFFFAISTLYCIKDLDAAVNSQTQGTNIRSLVPGHAV